MLFKRISTVDQSFDRSESSMSSIVGITLDDIRALLVAQINGLEERLGQRITALEGQRNADRNTASEPSSPTLIVQTRTPTPTPTSTLDPTIVHKRDPKIPTSPEFSDKSSEYRNFMSQCNITFIMCSNTYTTDEHKVLFILSLLRDSAFTWTREIPLNKNHPLRHDYPAFCKALDNLYGERNQNTMYEDKLITLRQIKFVVAYTIEFQVLAASLKLNK